MAQAKLHKETQNGNGSELNSKYRAIVREIDTLPPEMLTDLMRHILDTISQQLAGQNVASPVGPRLKGGDALSYLATDSATLDDKAENTDTTSANRSVFDELMTMMLRRDELSAEEQKRMRRMSYDAIMNLPPAEEPPPTDAEVKRMLHEHRMEKYGQ